MSQHSAAKVKASHADPKQMLGVNQENELEPEKRIAVRFLAMGTVFWSQTGVMYRL